MAAFKIVVEGLENRPLMYVLCDTYECIVSYLMGYNQGAIQAGGMDVLATMQSKAERELGGECNTHWSAVIRDHLALSDQEQAKAILFDLLRET